MSELPWSKFFWSDWEADQGLRLCSLAAQGLWMRMLCVCAKGDPRGYLAINGKPLDSTGVARLCGISAEEAESLMEELDLNGVFSRDRRGWIYNRRMMKDAKKSATGKKFAKKRWSQADDNKDKKSQPNGVPIGEPTTQRPEARSQSKKEEPVGSSKKARGSRLKSDWELPKAWGEWALSEGLAEAEVRAEAVKFKDYWLSASGRNATKLDWQAVWRNWCRNALERRPRSNSQQMHAGDELARWRKIASGEGGGA